MLILLWLLPAVIATAAAIVWAARADLPEVTSAAAQARADARFAAAVQKPLPTARVARSVDDSGAVTIRRD